MDKKQIENIKNETLKLTLSSVKNKLTTKYKEITDEDDEDDYLVNLLSEYKISQKVSANEKKIFSKFVKYAILDTLDEKIKNGNFSDDIYKDDDIIVFREGNFVYKFKDVIKGYDESLHELVVGMYGTNFIPSDIFAKIVGGYINVENPVTKKIGYSCVVSEYCDGINLDSWLVYHMHKNRDKPAYKIFRTILFDLVKGLYLAYKSIKFVHHDLHLGNVLIRDSDDKVKIIDFGRSRFEMNSKIYFYPFNIHDINHYDSLWENDIFKILILIYSYVDYDIELIKYHEKLERRFSEGFNIHKKTSDFLIQRIEKIYKENKIRAELYYNETEITKQRLKDKINEMENISLKIKRLKKMKNTPSDLYDITPMIRDLLSFFIDDDDINYYYEKHGPKVQSYIIDKKLSFDSFIERFNKHYTSRQI